MASTVQMYVQKIKLRIGADMNKIDNDIGNIFKRIYFKKNNKIRQFFINIYYGIENITSWFPLIWNDRDWDYSYLLRILNKKFDRMESYFNEYGITKTSESKARKILICKNLCKRLYEDDYMIKSHSTKRCFKIQEYDRELLCKYIKKYLLTWWD